MLPIINKVVSNKERDVDNYIHSSYLHSTTTRLSKQISISPIVIKSANSTINFGLMLQMLRKKVSNKTNLLIEWRSKGPILNSKRIKHIV